MKKERNATMLDDKGVEIITNAIVKQACDDYVQALMGYTFQLHGLDGDEYDRSEGLNETPENCIRELEDFFRSGWYSRLCDINPDWLMLNLQLKALSETITAYELLLSPSRFSTITLTTYKTKEQDGNKYVIPPKFIEIYKDLIRNHLSELRGRRAEIEETIKNSDHPIVVG